MIYPLIYKRTSAGAVQVWQAEVEGSKFRTISGQIDGKKTIAAWTQCEPKNVGRANEVSAEDQATAEVNALYKKQLRKDYKETIAEIDTKSRVKPMLAKKWADELRFFPDDQLFGFEPKLDGFRCLITKDGMFTRDGLPIVSSPHIFEDVKWVFTIHPTAEIDGELYNHDFHDNFNKISSLLKKQKPDADHFAKTKEVVQYWVYDIVFPEHPDLTQKERRATLEALFSGPKPIAHIVETKYIVVTPREVGTADQAADYFAKWKGENYEGAMGKPIDAPYEGKRSRNNLKIKEFIDEEFTIKDIQPGRGSRAEIAARAIVQLENGDTSEVGIIGDHDYCRSLLANKDDYIGTLGTVQYLNRTPDGRLRGGKLKEVNRFM